jgi:hypothetical protein
LRGKGRAQAEDRQQGSEEWCFQHGFLHWFDRLSR